jgi:D-glycero-D-manno-heptose 1,7-bisphosphate phosphatase
MRKPASFLDRDGVINVEKGYVYNISDFEWIAGAKNTIKRLNDNNFYVFVVTNQSGISKGLYTESDVIKLHEYINQELETIDAHIDDFFYSPYHPDFPDRYVDLSNLRKPNTGMLEMAEKKWDFDKSKSFLIGDKETDLNCADKYGIKGYLFESNNLENFIKKII